MISIEDRLIVGLGNPGRDYAETRHNAGFLLVDHLIERFGAQEERGESTYLLWSARRAGRRVFLMKPVTYMNRSGLALVSFLQRFPLRPLSILVIFDDVALPLGLIRIKPSGSAGGQKGMGHIIRTLETSDIPRLRIGIDSQFRNGLPLPDFVLSPFHPEEEPLAREALARAAAAAELWLCSEMTTLMARFNTKASSLNKDPQPTQEMEENVE